MSAADAYAASVPFGATLVLGEWQHGCSASIVAKTDLLRALAHAGHRVRVLVEARAQDVADLVAAHDRGRAEVALGGMAHVYRSREFLELIEHGQRHPPHNFLRVRLPIRLCPISA